MLNEFVIVAKVGDIEDNSMINVSAGDEEILLAKVNGELFAIEDCCTHALGMLSMGDLHLETCEVQCPIHEGRFDLRTGEVTAPPPEEPVVSYEVRIQGDDIHVGPKG